MKTELCVFDSSGLQLAKKYGFDRVEICQALELGGLTPSNALIHEAIKHKPAEIHLLIRPRPGAFNFNSAELELQLAEIRMLREFPIQGFVVGALTDKRQLHLDWMREARRLAPSLAFTCHRAFDDLPDWEAALEELVALGYKRILSSGLASSVEDGAEVLAKMSKRAKNRIELMCGGGVNAKNAAELCRQIKPDALHFSGTQQVLIDSESHFKIPRLLVSENKIKAILNEIR